MQVGIKVIAHGLVVGPRAYLKESWNVADCTIAVIGAVSDFAPSDDGEGGYDYGYGPPIVDWRVLAL